MKAFFVTLLVVGCLMSLTYGIGRILLYIPFSQEIGGHMGNAAHSNTIELAKQEMTKVVEKARSQGLTSGFTSVVYRTPDEDLGFWFSNMEASLNELNKMPATASELEKSNTLMKLRESLQASGEKGSTTLVVPDGISVYPHNLAWAFLGIAGLVLAVLGFFGLVIVDPA